MNNKLKSFVELIKAQSLEIEKRIENGKVYIKQIDGSKYYLKSLDEYIELKGYGESIRGVYDE